MAPAAEQIFRRPDGGMSSLIWLGHTRPLIFLLHDHQWWRGWPDKWDGHPLEPVETPEGYVDSERGFGYLVCKAGLTPLIGHAIRKEQSYSTHVQEMEDGWVFKDSYGRLLYLQAPMDGPGALHWSVMEHP